ncbi:MAG: LysR family transcriptional regulator [Mesorhizobium sp.]|nr:MAG: LysR family transcriptional regulator [Mesorhizobium sp.]
MARLLPGTRALRTLEAAARHLNFTRAADELGLTPAAVSHQIKEIEDQLGIVLFTRTSRTIRLTEAGTVLFEASTEALDLLGRAVSRAHKLARGTALLKVTLYTHRLFDNIIIPVCSPSLLASGPPLREPRDLFHHTLAHIEWARQGVTWPNWRMWMAAAGVDDFDDSRTIVFGTSTDAVQAALDGNAVALADFAMVANDLSEGRLIRPFELGIRVPPDFAYHLVYPVASANDARIVAFRDWLLNEVHNPQPDTSLG